MYPDNSTQQVMHCRCPKNSVPYLIKRHAYHTASGIGFQYSYACSPQTVSFLWDFPGVYCRGTEVNFNWLYYPKWGLERIMSNEL